MLRIWGRPQGAETESLGELVKTLHQNDQVRIEWMGEYSNQNIVQNVFDWCDAIVVPSIWVENSPLVIHEALQARLPVITANCGGMSEYVHHEENGLLFAHRNPYALAEQMQRFVDDPEFARKLGERGHLYSEDGNITDMNQHSHLVEEHYAWVLSKRKENQKYAT